MAAVFDALLEHLLLLLSILAYQLFNMSGLGESKFTCNLCSSGLYLLLLVLCYFVLLFQSFPGASELSFSELMLRQPLHPCPTAVPCWSPLIPAFSHFISAPAGRTPALFQTNILNLLCILWMHKWVIVLSVKWFLLFFTYIHLNKCSVLR